MEMKQIEQEIQKETVREKEQDTKLKWMDEYATGKTHF